MVYDAVIHKQFSREEALKRISQDFPFLEDAAFCRQLSSPKLQSCKGLYVSGKIMGLLRPTGLRFPCFQIHPETLTIRPAIAQLIDIARAGHRSDAQLVIWLCSPSEVLEGYLPVNCLDRTRGITAAARCTLTVEW